MGSYVKVLKQHSRMGNCFQIGFLVGGKTYARVQGGPLPVVSGIYIPGKLVIGYNL